MNENHRERVSKSKDDDILNNLFGKIGDWYKGNLHMHTTRSDGCLSPDDALSLYQKAGYDFAALTDHWAQSQNSSFGRMLLLSGCEWDTGDMIHSPVYHIIGVGMEREVKLEHSQPPQKIIDAIREAGGMAILAHPAWSVTDPEAVLSLTGLCGAEIYNSISGLPWNGERADSSLYFDLWASKGKLIPCMAADDSHHYNGEQTRSYLMVRAQECTQQALKKALESGSFYASQGPEFQAIRVGDGKVEVECSDSKYIVFNSNSIWCKDRVASGTHAVYQVEKTDRYVRVMLVDGQGRKAWSSPFAVNS